MEIDTTQDFRIVHDLITLNIMLNEKRSPPSPLAILQSRSTVISSFREAILGISADGELNIKHRSNT